MALAAEGVRPVTTWNITIEAADEPDDTVALDAIRHALDEFLVLLEPYDPVIIAPAEEPSDGLVRYGADLTVSASTLDEAYEWARALFRQA